MSDIESFIRSQKEKLNRDKNGSNQGFYQAEQNYQISQPQIINNHKQQLEQYLNSTNSNGPYKTQYPIVQNNPPTQQPQYNQQNQQPQQFNQPIQQSQQINQNSNVNNFKQVEEKEEFFSNFGKYDNKKSKLKNDLHNEYNEYLKKNPVKGINGNKPKESDKFFATLPLDGMNSSKPKKLQNNKPDFATNKSIRDRKARNKKDPDIKPYSTPQESVNTYNPVAEQIDSQQSRRNSYEQYMNDQYQIQNQNQNYRPVSQNSLEYFNQPQPEVANIPQRTFPQQYDSYQPAPAAAIDPSLTAILSRPPVGYTKSFVNVPQYQPQPQYNSGMSQPLNQIPNIELNQSNQQNYYPKPQQNQPKSNFPTNNPPKTSRAKDEGVFDFSNNNQNNKETLKAQKAKEYQNELNAQIREKQLQKQREKEAQNTFDEKMRIENLSYDPYGKSGGGAPVRDNTGNIVANLNTVKANPSQFSPRELQVPQNVAYPVPNAPQYGYPAEQTNKSVNFGEGGGLTERRAEQEKVHARGGNGIFGEAKSDGQKKKEDKYKEELQKQIDEKKRLKEEEKQKQRIEDEKEYARIMAQQARIKQELEEEERKRQEKEEAGRKINKEEGKRIANEKNKMPAAAEPAKKPLTKFQKFKQQKAQETEMPPPPSHDQTPFRSDSPPVPAIGKKMNTKGNSKPPPVSNTPRIQDATADYFVTESKLNLSSPNQTYESPRYQTNNKSKQFSRENSEMSNNEVLMQLKNLKKHLHKEQMQVENELNNTNNRTNIGQLSDIRHRILNVETPPGDKNVFYSALNKEPAHVRRETSDFNQKTYRKEIDTPPINGGLEHGTYFREGSVLLDQKPNRTNENIFEPNNLEREASQRQINKLSLNLLDDDLNLQYDTQLLSARNQQRLRKLRDLEEDNLSNADPNEVLDKFLNKNNRLVNEIQKI